MCATATIGQRSRREEAFPQSADGASHIALCRPWAGWRPISLVAGLLSGAGTQSAAERAASDFAERVGARRPARDARAAEPVGAGALPAARASGARTGARPRAPRRSPRSRRADPGAARTARS